MEAVGGGVGKAGLGGNGAGTLPAQCRHGAGTILTFQTFSGHDRDASDCLQLRRHCAGRFRHCAGRSWQCACRVPDCAGAEMDPP